jgi:hypothetical protein
MPGLQVVGGDPPGPPEATDVVHQDIHPRVRGQHRIGEPPHLGLPGQVGGERVHRRTAGLAGDLDGDGRGTGLAPPDDPDAGAEHGQAERGGPADATGATGDQHGPAGHRPG